jgi:hypothetical protein
MHTSAEFLVFGGGFGEWGETDERKERKEGSV